MVNIMAFYLSLLHLIKDMLSPQVTLISLTIVSSSPTAISNVSFYFPHLYNFSLVSRVKKPETDLYTTLQSVLTRTEYDTTGNVRIT